MPLVSSGDLGLKLLGLSAAADAVQPLLNDSLAVIAETLDANAAQVVRGEKGLWRVLARWGQRSDTPASLLSEVLDAGVAQCEGNWGAAALNTGRSELLAVRFAAPPKSSVIDQLTSAAAALTPALTCVRAREKHERRVRRLEAILEIAAQWNQTNEMETLLMQMAQTSTSLLGAERASIFLWDKPNRTLVGRPALGVEGNELRIPDDRGVVGQVVQSGEPRRVDADIQQEQKEIDRTVDKQLAFQTRNLLCVPLRGRHGEMLGAFELINKVGGNFTAEDQDALVELATHAATALENTQEMELLLATRRQMADHAAQGIKLIGDSPAIDALRSTIKRVAHTDLAILILGENGTGKEVVAQSVHYLSPRRNEPFVAVNCAALAETLLESELFGHEKGAFTDAHEARAGKFELASGGTLFLDEIGDMSLSGQAKLLRVLEEKVVVRVGGSRPIHTDARVLAATNQNLGKMVREKKFREDLFFRLNVVSLELPPMRDRGDDILLLAEHFLSDFCVKARRKAPKFTAEAKKRLRTHAWPGNVRELRNLMERLAYLTQGEKIDADDLAFILAPGEAGAGMVPMDLPLGEATDRFQLEYIQKHLDSARGNITDAARRMGMHRSNLYRKMRQLGMDVEEA
jgi:Nif-specific regulatory protein